ncbi:hypothetical protein ACFWA9_03185 [Kitasatospora sp. NPDC059973]|uniref:hypothetical protein n=1 Tax=Kitasatospora sp. NPDC059973 TaxID=3347020 RepID=UPI0036C19254
MSQAEERRAVARASKRSTARTPSTTWRAGGAEQGDRQQGPQLARGAERRDQAEGQGGDGDDAADGEQPALEQVRGVETEQAGGGGEDRGAAEHDGSGADAGLGEQGLGAGDRCGQLEHTLRAEFHRQVAEGDVQAGGDHDGREQSGQEQHDRAVQGQGVAAGLRRDGGRGQW